LIIEHRTIDLFEKKVFEKAIVTPPFKNPTTLPDEACFLYVLEGGLNSYSDETQISYGENEGVLMKCGNYMYEATPNKESGRCGMVAIHFYPEVLKKIYEKEIPDFLKNKNKVSFHSNMVLVKSSILIKKYFENLQFYFENPGMANEELLSLKMKEIILLLLNTKNAPAIIEIMYNLFSPGSFSFRKVVEAHIFSPIAITDLAHLTNSSLASFKREFKKIYRDSPANYIKNKRLEKAAELLLVSNKPISTIAYDCLFNEMAHFSNSFKEKYKCSPSQYRLSQLHK
jgi:AraC family transcriptional regulator, exoenzyme S synthesis regulatory protein ExsA